MFSRIPRFRLEAAASGQPGGSDTTQFDAKAIRRAVRGNQPVLTLISGLQIGKTAVFDANRLTIGRDTGCTLTLIDAGISRFHAKLEKRANGEVVVIDLDSTNGVHVNGDAVRECTLAPGDKIQLGPDALLSYRLEDIDEVRARLAQYERSITDQLTGLHNRHHFQAVLEREVAYLRKRETISSALLLIDIDHFKRVNDTHGHEAGDHVLREVAGVMAAATRHKDVLGRWGGEEFALLLRGLDVAAAAFVAERLRQRVKALAISVADTTIGLTISIGVAAVHDPGCTSAADVMRAADKCLYRAKREGRDRVVAP